MAMQLPILDPNQGHHFLEPRKRINEGQDVSTFLVSKAYKDISLFLMQLNKAMFPRKKVLTGNRESTSQSATVSGLQSLLVAIDGLTDDVPLDPGTHRFGNTAFRKWHQLLEQKSTRLLEAHLSKAVIDFPRDEGSVTSIQELGPYLLGSFGSAQRLDYGTGHELSFIAFIAGIWKLGGFVQTADGSQERSITLDIIQPYLVLIRRLISKYSLEPAGSHGVWGLDDHSFIPYILGSAQYGPAVADSDSAPVEGSSPTAPNPTDIVKGDIVAKERINNLYFGAIGFIYDVKTGPFWEHSPTLFDISGVRAGWAKINKGMLKMYDAEVLSKFPVVQHFPFGSLFSFERDPMAKDRVSTTHIANQPSHSMSTYNKDSASITSAPWARAQASGTNQSAMTVVRPARPAESKSLNTNAIRSSASVTEPDSFVPTRAPWANDNKLP